MAASPLWADSPTDQAAEFFESRVRPVLVATCFRCHGGEKTSGGLRVDSRAALVAGGDHGAAIVPGRPAESLLVRALRRQDDEVVMPPDEPLAKATVDDLARWIEHGAVWPESNAGARDAFAAGKHWAFQPVARAGPPVVVADGSSDPIDRFIDARRREQGLVAVGAADRVALLRRACFDLIGLPPEPEEIAHFVDDKSPNAFARRVDRLLASPRYGERWGRHWLDVVRYADTAGDNADYPVPEASLYRDYVIDAFNADKPYDQFVREQLAGDLLAVERIAAPEKYREQTIATGYLALSRRYATAPYELWHLTLEDTIDTTGKAFLGLTLRCARCHDHKFDPVTQQDYYALYGIFESTQFPWAGGEEFQSKKTPRQHFVPLLPPAQSQERRTALAKALERLPAEISQAEAAGESKKLAVLRQDLERCEQAQKLDAPPDLPVAYAVGEGKPADAFVHKRGEPADRGPTIPRGVPKFLQGPTPVTIPAGASGRLQLAQWLTAPDNPLTARVMVNRIWQWHFGRGLVATPSNFGLRGARPTHPELLDWLARRFIESGWSIKSLHRDIMLSRTYQLASAGQEANSARDPANDHYWRFDRRRLDAEAIRDAMLAASGRLDLERPTSHPFPQAKDWKWTQHAPFNAVYSSPHRSVYLMTQRIQRHPFLALFDGPDTNMSTDVRTSAIVPTQALFLMNDLFVAEQAQGLGARLISAASDVRQRVELACLLCWSRAPSKEETDRAVAYLEQVAVALRAAPTPADTIEPEVWSSYARVMLASSEFMYID